MIKKIVAMSFLMSSISCMADDTILSRAPRPVVNNPPEVVATDISVARDVNVLRDVYVKGSVVIEGDLIASGTVLGGQQQVQNLFAAPFMAPHAVASPLIIQANAGNQARLLLQENSVERARVYSTSGVDGLQISTDSGATSVMSIAANNDITVSSRVTIQSDLSVANALQGATFCAVDNGFDSFSVNYLDPAAPTILDTVSVGGITFGLGSCLALDDSAQFLYTFPNGGDTLYKINVSNPAQMSIESSLVPSAGNNITALVYRAGFVYVSVAAVNRLYAVNATTMGSVGFVAMAGSAQGMVSGTIGGIPAVFAAEDAVSSVESFDVTNPAAMVRVDVLNTIDFPVSLALNGTTLFVDNPFNGINGSLDSFDVTDLLFAPLDSVGYPSNLGYSALATQGDFVYRAGIDVEGLINVYRISSAAFVAASDVSTQSSKLIVVGNYLYASAYASSNGYQLYSLSNPMVPIQQASINLGDPSFQIAATPRYVFSKGGTITSLDNAQLIPAVALSVVGTATLQGDLNVGRAGSVLYASSIYNSVGINVAGPGSNFALDVVGDVHATSYSVSSDYNLKENIVSLPSMADKLLHIEGVMFDWNATYGAIRKPSAKKEIGVIAQSVEQQFPELVSCWRDPVTLTVYRTVDYDRLAAILLTVANEHTAQLQTYRDEVAQLETRLQQLVESRDKKISGLREENYGKSIQTVDASERV